MTNEESNKGEPSPEFCIEISGFMLFLKRFIQIGAIWSLLVTIIQSFHEGEHLAFIAGILNFGILWAAAKYLIRSFPRKVTVEGDSLVFHKVPTVWIDLNGIPIPLGIAQRVAHPKSTIVLEWIGRSLTLNDMTKGKSIRLAAGKHADSLAAWFKSVGVQPPCGG